MSKPIQECQGSGSILDQAACFIENAQYQQAIVTLEQRLTMTPMDDEVFYLLLWDWALVRNAYYDLDEDERLPEFEDLANKSYEDVSGLANTVFDNGNSYYYITTDKDSMKQVSAEAEQILRGILEQSYDVFCETG